MSVQFRHFIRFWRIQATRDRSAVTHVNRFLAHARMRESAYLSKRRSASSGLSIVRLPSARRFTST